MRILRPSHPGHLDLKGFLPPFLLGYLSFSFQTILLREFSANFYGNEISFGLVLAGWFLWGGLGSILSGRRKLSSEYWPHFFVLTVFLFALALLGLRFSWKVLDHLPGEITALLPMLAYALALTLIISFPCGILFVLNSRLAEGRVLQVYLRESVGALVAGLTLYFLLTPLLSNWQTAALVGIGTLILVFFLSGRKAKALSAAALSAMVALALSDRASQKLSWKPFSLVAAKDGLYGKVQVLKDQEQTSLYSNGLLVYSSPNIPAAEESIHFAMLQNPEAESVLLVGGGAGGGLEQALKYPKVSIDYVELDPEIIRLSLEHLPAEEKSALFHPRVRLHLRDGRAFLKKSRERYDFILLNLPVPATAQINRFFTKEFFLMAQAHLRRNGIFSFWIPSSEEYIAPELRQFLATLFFTLKSVFPEVRVIPGGTNIFLASERPLSIDLEFYLQRLRLSGLNNTYVSAQVLPARLDPRRIQRLENRIRNASPRLNLDLLPICYYFDSLHWASQFSSVEKGWLTFLSRLSPVELLGIPLSAFLLFMALLWMKKEKTSRYLVPLAVMGFTTIVSEILVLIAFQTFYGFVYRKIALLLACFMGGLSLGAIVGIRRERRKPLGLLLLQAGLIFILLVFLLSLRPDLPEAGLFLILLALGYLGGEMFVWANSFYLKGKQDFGTGYGLELVGSFVGALLASSILLPLLGFKQVLVFLILLNSLCFLFLGLRLKKAS